MILIAERDKYGVNDIVPRFTGWAQVNGRDELPIDAKAKYDGVVEGGTGEIKREKSIAR